MSATATATRPSLAELPCRCTTTSAPCPTCTAWRALAGAIVHRRRKPWHIVARQQILQHAAERLLGDLEDGEQLAHRQIGLAADEVKRAVVGAPEIHLGEKIVHLGQEIPVAEKEILDAAAQLFLAQIEQRGGRLAGWRF